jgi:hypothetical protein
LAVVSVKGYWELALSLLLLCARRKNTTSAVIARAPTATPTTPTPIPAFAPADRPVEALFTVSVWLDEVLFAVKVGLDEVFAVTVGLDVVLSGVEVGLDDVLLAVEVELDVTPNTAGIVMALGLLQHVRLFRPQHQVADVGVPSHGVIRELAL